MCFSCGELFEVNPDGSTRRTTIAEQISAGLEWQDLLNLNFAQECIHRQHPRFQKGVIH